MYLASGRGMELIWLRCAINWADRNKLAIILLFRLISKERERYVIYIGDKLSLKLLGKQNSSISIPQPQFL